MLVREAATLLAGREWGWLVSVGAESADNLGETVNNPPNHPGHYPSEHSSLVDAVRVVRERWWLVVVCFVVSLGVSLAISLHAVKQYTASATLLIRPSNLTAVIDPTQAQGQDAASLARQQSDDASLTSSSPVAARVKRALGLRDSVSDLQGRVSTSVDSTNDLMDISVTDPDPARAARMANAFATALVGYLTESAQALLVTGQAKLQAELARLPANDPGRSALAQGLKQVVALKAVTNGGAQVINPAEPPTSPSSPLIKRNAALGGIVGIVLGVVLAFLNDLFDRRIKTAEEIERLYGLPALASVPVRRRRPASEREAQAELEPFRILRDGLSYVSLRRDTRVVLVTSAVPGEGKTRVASGLARALAAANKPVALVEVDIHRPAIKSEFNLTSNGRGLMNAIVDGTSPLDFVEAVPKLPALSVLPSGPFTPNSAELLRLPAMTNILSELAGAFQFVVLDGPPLLPVADAQVLLDNQVIDAVLVVARVGLTTRQQVRGAQAVLQRHPEKGLGLVVNWVREAPGGYYYRGSTANGTSPPRRGLRRRTRVGQR